MSKRKLFLWLAAGAGSTGVALAVIFGVAVAVLGASFTDCQPGDEPAGVSTGPTPSAYALQNIPPERLRLYEQAGQRFEIDWSFLASIGAQECGNGNCAGVNSAGCAGPMQIAYVRGSACSPGSGPTLWERYAVSAHPGHPPDINDPADAIYTAARILRQDKGAPPTGGSYTEYRQAACHYYGACGDSTVAYADEVMARAVQYGFTGNGAPQATSPQLGQPVTASQSQCDASAIAPEGASASAILKVAESQIGEGEQPPGSNCTRYGPCEEWCSLFASWVWMKAGVPIPGPTVLYGYSGSLYRWAAEHGGRILPANARPSPGDAVFFGKGPAESVHVGLVSRVLRDGRIETIDGNNSENKVGRAGPFQPSRMTIAGEPIYGYAQPPAPNSKKA
ncbi:MAG: CHAP domain-containing protein [Solirubrobacteraceae bacterium]